MVNVTIVTAGTSGPRGNGWLSGVGAPSNSIGFNGDFYIDTTNTGVFYGPKANGVWPSSSPFTTGALLAVNNLSDVASVSGSRNNLGLGGAAVLNVGTGAGTVAAGNDSRIVNAIPNTTVTTKGDLIAATGNAAVTRQGVGTDTYLLTADSTQTTGMKWAPPPAAGSAVFPLSGYGLLTASDDPLLFQNVSGLSSGTVFGARCWVPANTALSHLTAAVRTGGTYNTSTVPNQLGIYDDTGAQLQVSPNDNTLWNNAGWAIGAITTVAAQATGRFVYILYILGGFTGVNVPYALGANDLNAPFVNLGPVAGNRRAFYLNGQTGLPASFNPTSVGTSTGFTPLVGAY